MARVYSSGDTAMAEPSRPLRINERIAFTTYLSLSNCTYQRDFDTYKAAEQSLSSKIASITLLFVVIVVQLFWRFQQSSSIQTYAVGFGVLLPLLMLMYLYASTRKQQYGDSSSRVSVRIIGDMLIISRLLVQGLLIISVAKEGQCDDRVRVPWNCNPVHDQGELPMAYVTNLIFGMITLPVMFRCHTALVNLISIVCYGVVLVTALYFSNSRVFSYVSLLLIVFGILLTMYDYEYMIAQAFATKMEHSALLLATAENEKSMLMHENAQDARHFIGNVAHDLKTPLQALTSEIELLEREQSCSAGSFEPLRSTCCYMTMTINR